jgi:hypothetical protein
VKEEQRTTVCGESLWKRAGQSKSLSLFFFLALPLFFGIVIAAQQQIKESASQQRRKGRLRVLMAVALAWRSQNVLLDTIMAPREAKNNSFVLTRRDRTRNEPDDRKRKVSRQRRQCVRHTGSPGFFSVFFFLKTKRLTLHFFFRVGKK